MGNLNVYEAHYWKNSLKISWWGCQKVFLFLSLFLLAWWMQIKFFDLRRVIINVIKVSRSKGALNSSVGSCINAIKAPWLLTQVMLLENKMKIFLLLKEMWSGSRKEWQQYLYNLNPKQFAAFFFFNVIKSPKYSGYICLKVCIYL